MACKVFIFSASNQAHNFFVVCHNKSFSLYTNKCSSSPLLWDGGHRAPMCTSLAHRTLICTALPEGSCAPLYLSLNQIPREFRFGVWWCHYPLVSNPLHFSFLKIYLVKTPDFILLVISPFSHEKSNQDKFRQTSEVFLNSEERTPESESFPLFTNVNMLLISWTKMPASAVSLWLKLQH